MKLQFSLATLLVCVTVLAVVIAISVQMPVTYKPNIANSYVGPYSTSAIELNRSPKPSEIEARIAIWGIPSVAATLAMLWAIRRLKSRRENGPPVG
jgi:hypothetical protein